MRWTTDARLQRVLDALPRGDDVRYLLQRHIARTLPIDETRFEREMDYADRHWSVLGAETSAPTWAVEIGAGRHLTVAIQLAERGLHVVATDVAALVRTDLVRDAARRLGGMAAAAVDDGDDLDRWLGRLGITYQVVPPSSLAGIQDESIDLVYSTSVLEHVPTDQLSALLAEAARVLRPGGYLSCIIDYKDHYAYGDPSIGRLNFLAVPASRWFRMYSPASHYQNRLRHHEMVTAVEGAGFSVEARDVLPPSVADLAWLESNELDLPFRGRPVQEVGIGEAHLVARKLHGGTLGSLAGSI